MNKYCSKCGNMVNENDNFCGYCRNSLNNNISELNNQNMMNNNTNFNQSPAENIINGGMNNMQNAYQTQNINNNQNIGDKTNGLAVTGFIMSIASFSFCCGLLSLPSLIISIIGLVKINKTKEKGKGLAIAGLIISILTILVCILYVFLFIADIMDLPSYIPVIDV